MSSSLISARSRLSSLCFRSTLTSSTKRWVSTTEEAGGSQKNERRLESEPEQFPPNDSINTQFVYNRNPRNLEKLRIGEKPVGWTLEKKGRCFWNKLTFEITGKHVHAKVEHFSGIVAATASSQEWCIRKFLYSTRDISAIKAVGKVLAQRCLEMGIYELFTIYTDEDRKKEKIDVFLKTFEDAGIALSEPEQYEKPVYLNEDKLPEKGWEVFEDVTVKEFPTNLEVEK